MAIGSAWKRLKWIGLAPLVFSLGYALANGIGRFSGWRYDLPADWVSYFYFGIGVVEIFSLFALFLGASAQRLFTKIPFEQSTAKFDIKFALPVMAAFILIGSLPWIAEHAVTPHTFALSESALIEQTSQVPAVQTAHLTQDQVNRFLFQNTNPNAEVLQGRVLYPRFFWRGQGIAQAHPSPAYVARDYSRLGFLLMTDQITPIVFQSKTVLPVPEAGDAIIFGCKHLDYIEARVIILPAQNLIFQNDSFLDQCNNSDQ